MNIENALRTMAIDSRARVVLGLKGLFVFIGFAFYCQLQTLTRDLFVFKGYAFSARLA
jgi:hypothetical protein